MNSWSKQPPANKTKETCAMSETYLGTPPDYVDKWLKAQEVLVPFYFKMPSVGARISATSSDSSALKFLASKDGIEWEEWNYVEGTEVKGGEMLYLKNQTAVDDLGKTFSFKFQVQPEFPSITGMFAVVGGNAVSLLRADFATVDYSTYSLKEGAFAYLFSECGGAIFYAGELVFPGLGAVAPNAFYQAFAGNSGLVMPPRLLSYQVVFKIVRDPVTFKEYSSCLSFEDMFKGCAMLPRVRFARELESSGEFKEALEHSSCFGAVNAKAVFDL